LNRHRKIVPFRLEIPEYCRETTTVCDSATLVGNVKIGRHTAIWYGAVLRGDDGPVRVGEHSCIGDSVVINNSTLLPDTVPRATLIGSRVIIGPGSFLKSNIIDDDCRVGENCLLREGARMERGSSLGNNSTLLPGVCIPSGQHWEGSPAVYVKEATHTSPPVYW